MSEKPSHLPAKLALVAGLAGAAALHPQSLTHDEAPHEALQAPQPPAVSLPHQTPQHPVVEQPHHHQQTPTPKPTEVPTVATHSQHEAKHVIKAVETDRWTSHAVIEPPHPITPPKKPPTKQPGEYKPLPAENYTVPADVSAIMKTETAYLPWSRCSAFLIRDAAGKPIGFDSAEHCGLLASSNPTIDKQDYHYNQRWLGSDGQYYIVIKNQPVDVETGDNQRQLQSVGTVSEIIAPGIDDLNHDLVLGVLDGSTPEEVLAAYTTNQLSAQELAALTPGETLYSSGWPIAQPNNPGALERQEFAQAYLGTIDLSFDTGQTIQNMVVTAVPKNADGSICSPGDSGSEVFNVQQNSSGLYVARSVGIMTGYIDLTGKLSSPQSAKAALAYYQERFGRDLSEMGALCFISTQAPTIDPSNGSLVHVVSNPDQIPGYDQLYSPQAEMDRARESFFNPSNPQTVIDGLVALGGDKSGNFTWVYRPALYYDPVTGGAVLEWYDPSATDNLEQVYFDDTFYITVYAWPSTNQAQLLYSVGQINPIQPDTTGGSGSFEDSNGLTFGNISPNEPADFQQAYRLQYDPQSKSLSLVLVVLDGGKGGGKGGGK